jgi:hypothetical protein
MMVCKKISLNGYLLNKKICQVMPANSFGLAMLLLLHSAE